ncbi:MAG TPA: LysR family transcriptional regulator [Steroidobacteraceae bacterium]
MRFELTDLQLFVRIAELASISRGAARTNMSLASASARVRKMEELAGARLLERGRRGVALSAAGRALVYHARLVLQQIEHMKGELSEYAGGLRGLVRLQANSAAVSEFLPEALGEFLAAHPGIGVDVEEISSHEIVRAVAGGFVDVGIVADIADCSGLQTFPFAIDRLVVVTQDGHPTARRRVAFRDLLEHEFVGMVATNALQQHLSERAIAAGKPLRLRVRLNSFQAVCRMVGNGVGLAVMPETAARRFKTGALRISRLSDSWSLRRLHVCVRPDGGLTPPARELVAHLRRQGERAQLGAV